MAEVTHETSALAPVLPMSQIREHAQGADLTVVARQSSTPVRTDVERWVATYLVPELAPAPGGVHRRALGR